MSSLYTKFYGSQVGGKSTTPHSYTSSPLSLLKYDILSALHYYLYLPYIVFPLFPQLSGPLCELYPSRSNLYDIFLHSILILIQLPFVLSVPFWLIFPLWWVVGGVAAFWVLNESLCIALNGSVMEVESRKEFAERRTEHEHEQWIFLNGVAVGRNWLQNNVDRLALTFGRPVLGVHNKTNGIIFDVFQCLIQRNFTYATQDVRDCYSIVKSLLYQPHLTKVIFILHSQGGIEGGLIIDWLLQEVPQDLLAKLEIYTFGNAANHFNNPHLHLLSQHAALSHPKTGKTIKTTTSVHYHDLVHPVPSPHASPLPPAEGTSNGTAPLNTTPPTPVARQVSRQESTSGKTIRYIEHYAHTSDFVARWGVLHFTKELDLGPSAPRFMGRVFERSGKGHQMNMHYLDGMFPLRRVEASSPSPALPVNEGRPLKTKLSLATPDPTPSHETKQEQHVGKAGIGGSGFLGADEREGRNPFMESILELGLGDQDGRPSEREGLAMSYLGAHGEPLEDSERGEHGVLVRDISPISPGTMKRFKVNGNGRGGGGGGGDNRHRDLDMTSAQSLGGKVVVMGDGGWEGEEKMRFRVKDLSRLWLYVNGKSPKIDETDVGIARMATI